MRPLTAALVHHPVLDRQGKIVTTAITNLDLHDIARSAHTFGLNELFIVHPVGAQRELAERVRAHWVSGSGARRIPDRMLAMQLIRVEESLASVIAMLGGAERVEIWTTSARTSALPIVDYPAARELLRGEGRAVLLLFGTGWGLAAEVHALAARQLAPIASPRKDGYNHLSVRAAAAITFARLLGS